MQVPNGVSLSNSSSLGVLKGCLCVINIDDSFLNGLWVMKEYGVVESWIKFAIVRDVGFSDVPLHLREDNHNLVVTDYCTFVLVVTCAQEAKLYSSTQVIDPEHRIEVGMF